jgi:hypothetical protein
VSTVRSFFDEYQRLEDLWHQVYLHNAQIQNDWAGANYMHFNSEIQEPVDMSMKYILEGLSRFYDALEDAENVLNQCC